MRSFWALALALTRSSAVPAFRRAAPLYFAIVVAAAVLFAGNGLDASTVVRLADESLAVRLGLWIAWLVVVTPLAHTLLDERSSFLLRSLPVPRTHFWLVCGAHLACAELPWTVLWSRGGGALAGLSATVLAVAAHALIVARPQRVLEWLAAALVALSIARPDSGTWHVAPEVPRLAALVLALWGARIGVAAAFRRAPERAMRRRRRMVFGPAPIALALSHLVSIRRADSALFVRVLALTLLGGAVAALAVRNNGIASAAELDATALEAGALPLALSAASLVRPMLACERAAHGFFAANGTRRALHVGATSLALGACGAVLGLGFGVVVALGAPSDGPRTARLLALCVAAGLALAVVVAGVARRAERGDPNDAARILVAVLAVAAGGIVLLALAGELAVGLWGIGGIAIVAWGTRPHGALRASALRTPPGAQP